MTCSFLTPPISIKIIEKSDLAFGLRMRISPMYPSEFNNGMRIEYRWSSAGEERRADAFAAIFDPV